MASDSTKATIYNANEFKFAKYQLKKIEEEIFFRDNPKEKEKNEEEKRKQRKQLVDAQNKVR